MRSPCSGIDAAVAPMGKPLLTYRPGTGASRLLEDSRMEAVGCVFKDEG